MVEPAVHLDNHPVIQVEPLSSDSLKDRMAAPPINQLDPARSLAQPHHLHICHAEWTFAIIDDTDRCLQGYTMLHRLTALSCRTGVRNPAGFREYGGGRHRIPADAPFRQ